MKAIKTLNSVLFLAIMSLVVSTVTDLHPAASFGGLVALSLIPMPQGVALMAVTRELWTQDIVNGLWARNEFALKSKDHSPFVIAGTVVHIPTAGSASGTTRNETSFPVSVTRRTDTDLTYNIDTYRTNPTHVLNIEKYELAYDKRQSVLGEDQRALVNACMTGLLYSWGPAAAKVVRTTGATVAANLSGATGDRKAFHKDELGRIKVAMDETDVDPMGRVALLNARHHQELLDSFTDAEKTGFHAAADMKNGIVGRYLGFDIMMRSTVLRYRGADDAEAKVDTQAGAYAASDKTGDRKASLIWQPDCLTRAVGDTIMFDNTNDPTYYGDIYSFEQRLGGVIHRAAGVYAAVDAIV
ncbi:MAG: hypothetical protein ACT4OJ_14265 [Bacteroidota bacterium]